MRAIDHMDDDVCFGDLLQCGAKRFDKLVGQVSHKTHGVGECVRPTIGGFSLAHSRIQSRKERILDQHPGAGETVEKRGFSGVGVTGDCHRRDTGSALAGFLRLLALAGANPAILLAQPGNALVNPAAIESSIFVSPGPPRSPFQHPAPPT